MARCRLSAAVVSSTSLPPLPYETPPPPVSPRQASSTPRSLPSACCRAWVPLHEVRQTWASFAAQVEDAAAYAAIGSAFQALSWEASALRDHHRAAMDERRGMAPSATSWLEKALSCLSEASHQWSRAFCWLDRYATAEHLDPEAVEAVRPLCRQASAQQQRLAALIQAVQTDLFTWRHPPQQGTEQQQAPSSAPMTGNPQQQEDRP